jgi:hypothetical protein
MNFAHYAYVDLGDIYVEIDVDFDYWPEEAMVRYSPEGGYPGSPPAVEITNVRVTYVNAKTWCRYREDLRGWEVDLDRIALEAIEGDIYSDLLETADVWLKEQ